MTVQEQQNTIDKVKKSKAFSKAPTGQALLQYLFEATQKGCDLKEGIIDIEFFGGSKGSDKNNPRVRVNIYNLRKKLEKYYDEEGKNESIRIIIDKGQYLIRFEKKGLKERKINYPIIIPYALLVILSVSFFILSTPPQKPDIWKPFFSKKNPTTLYIGDTFGFLRRTISGQFGWMRHYDINSEKDYFFFRDAHPELKDDIKPSTYTYSTGMGVLSTQRLQALFQTYNHQFDIRFSTRTTIPEIIEGNALYVGPIKNENPFIGFFNSGNPYLKIKDDQLLLSDHPTFQDTVFNLHTRGIASEYAIVSKIQGPNNTEQFLFFSNHDIGVSSTVEYFTNKETLQAFQKEYLKNHQHFTAIFEAKGQDRTTTDLKLIMTIVH